MKWLALAAALAFGPLAEAGQAIVIDGDTLELDGVRYRINGIDAPEAGQKCENEVGRTWACGDVATETLYQMTRGTVRCQEITPDGYGRIVARCQAEGQDIGAAMVEAGMAWAFVKFSDEYAAQENRARAAGRGIWRGPSQPAWEYRSVRWQAAEQDAPEGCPIKGNISGNGKIYHPPWSPWYKRTRINTAKGERWFCDEAEAIRAGWRAPYFK